MIPLYFSNNVNKSITVLGCGWLGLPLAIKLKGKGWAVKGSTTRAEKLDLLANEGIDPFLVHLDNIDAVDTRFFNSDVLLINVPPGLRKRSEEAYLAEMEQLLGMVKLSPAKYVVFISSTSVYPELNRVISDVNNADTNSALYRSEQLFTQCKSFKTTVIRFAGLVGPGRDPSRFFAGKLDVPNGQAPINLIHLDDCIGLIEAVLEQQQFGFTYHAASPHHPAKQAFYTEAAQLAGLALPGFVDELKDWKVVDSSRMVDDLKYSWRETLHNR
jgi:nucleoside-diphosphate-sugar epimerase